MKLLAPVCLLALSLSLAFPTVAEAQRESPPERPRQEGEKPDPQRRAAPPREAQPEGTPRSEAQPRRDSRRPSEPEARGAGRRYELPQPGDVESRKMTFLGVSTIPLPYPLRDHLGLPHGFGLQLQEVSPGSPAAKAGFEPHDILVRFDDQRLISPEHLSLLVRSAKAGDRVEFHLIRRGEEKRIPVVLGEIEASALRREGRPHPREWQEPLRRQQDFWHDWMQRQHPAPPSPRSEGSPQDKRGPEDEEAEGETVALPDGDADAPPSPGRPPAISMRPGFPVSVFAAEGLVKIENEQGEAVLRFSEEGHRIELRNAEGAVVHEGPWDAEKGAEALPEAARDHLRTMKLDDLNLLQFRHSDPAHPERTTDEGLEKAPETEAAAELL